MGRMWTWHAVAALGIACSAAVVAADWGLSNAGVAAAAPPGMGAVRNATKSDAIPYHHVWPVMQAAS